MNSSKLGGIKKGNLCFNDSVNRRLLLGDLLPDPGLLDFFTLPITGIVEQRQSYTWNVAFV
jgi:hypothetical protein